MLTPTFAKYIAIYTCKLHVVLCTGIDQENMDLSILMYSYNQNNLTRDGAV